MDIVLIYDFTSYEEQEFNNDWFEISYAPNYEDKEKQYYKVHNLDTFFYLLEQSFKVREIEEGVLYFLQSESTGDKARLSKLDNNPDNKLLTNITLSGGYDHYGSYECWDAIVLEYEDQHEDF